MGSGAPRASVGAVVLLIQLCRMMCGEWSVAHFIVPSNLGVRGGGGGRRRSFAVRVGRPSTQCRSECAPTKNLNAALKWRGEGGDDCCRAPPPTRHT